MSRGKITRLALCIVVASFLLSTFASLWSLAMLSRRNMQDLNRMLAARIYDTIIGELAVPVIVAETMAHDSFLIDLLAREDTLPEETVIDSMKTYLSGFRDGLEYEAAFLISDSSRRYYSAEGLSKFIDPANDAYDLWYEEFTASGLDYALDVDNNEFSRDAWTVFVDARVEDTQGRLLGVCGVGDRMVKTQALFYALEKEYGVKIDLVTPDGLVQVDTDEARILTAVLEDVKLNPDGEYAYQRMSSDRFVVSKYVERLGWYLVVQSDGSTARSALLNVIILNVVLCLLVMVILILAARIIAIRTIALANASFHDQSTQLYNRRAFEEDKAALLLKPTKPDLVYVTADVNGLKTANDTLGHAAGDELICGAADCLRACFGRYGKIYRIGGDEFAAILFLSPDRLPEVQRELEAAMEGWSGKLVGKLSLSCGYVSSREFPSENLTELIRISDERMYAAKKAYYRRCGIDRRRT